MKYINQLEYPRWPYINRTNMDEAEREAGKAKTIATSGCGLCAAVMVADRLLTNITFNLQDALQLSYDTKANHKAGTDYKIFAPAFASSHVVFSDPIAASTVPFPFIVCLTPRPWATSWKVTFQKNASALRYSSCSGAMSTSPIGIMILSNFAIMLL